MDSVKLYPESREVASYISGYIVRKIVKNFNSCKLCDMVGSLSDKECEDYTYLLTVSQGGLIVPSKSLNDYVCHCYRVFW